METLAIEAIRATQSATGGSGVSPDRLAPDRLSAADPAAVAKFEAAMAATGPSAVSRSADSSAAVPFASQVSAAWRSAQANNQDMIHRIKALSDVEQQINEISELATLHHHYRKNANYQDAKKLLEYMPDWRINKSIKEFMLIYQGDVKLGYDLKDIKVNVDPVTKTIAIALPEPKILSHSIDFKSIQVLWEKKGWFNDIRFEDFKQFFIAEQKKYEEENNDELKRRAREHAQKIIQLYLGSVVKDDYQIKLD